MRAFVFPGQGAQTIGMGKALAVAYPAAKEVFDEVDDALGQRLSKLIWEGDIDTLTLTANAQPALMATSLAALCALQAEGVALKTASFVAGHSLGEYSALAAVGAISIANTARLLRIRGIAMQEAVPVGRGGMIAILGLAMNEIEKFILEAKEKGVCEIANDNADGQIIVSGNIEALDFLANNLKKDKKKSIKLPVSAPFHCSLMKSAAEKMNSKIQSTNFNNPKFKIVTNVKAEPEENADIIKKLLVEQIFSKVRWRESVLYMANNGVTDFIEIGPGKVLTGLIKRIVKNVNSNSINTTEDIKNLLNEPKK